MVRLSVGWQIWSRTGSQLQDDEFVTFQQECAMGTSIIPSMSTGDFTPERWGQLTEPLRRREVDLAQLAAEKALELHASSRWPELSLRRRSLLSIGEARISLDPNSLSERAPRWAVRVVRYPRWPLFAGRGATAKDIAVITDEELRGGRRLIDEMYSAVAALD